VKRNSLLIIIATAAALGVLFVAILALASFLSGGRRTSVPLTVGGGNVALVKIEGLLVNSDDVVDELTDYAEDSSIKAIVLRIDSPGGGVVA
jgi:protease IV